MSEEAVPFHLLAKPAGATCKMPDDVLEACIRQRLSQHNEPEVNIAWQGGEPTIMRLDFFKRAIELVSKHCKPEQKVQYTIQTNGLLLDEEWCIFLKKHDFLVGLSIDGPPENARRLQGRQAGPRFVRSGVARLGTVAVA